MRVGGVHHIEIWVPSIQRAGASWGWLLEALGYAPFQEWSDGKSWKLADTYIVVEESPDGTGAHDRTLAGLNHLALFGGRRVVALTGLPKGAVGRSVLDRYSQASVEDS